MLHTYHGLVHKAIWTIAYHTNRYMIPLGTSCSFVCWSILDQPCIFSSLFNRWCRPWSLQVDHLSWLRFAWWSFTYCSPILHYGRASHRHIFTWPLSPRGWQALSIWYLQDTSLEHLHFSSLMTITTWHHSSWAIWNFHLMQAHGKIPNHT